MWALIWQMAGWTMLRTIKHYNHGSLLSSVRIHFRLSPSDKGERVITVIHALTISAEENFISSFLGGLKYLIRRNLAKEKTVLSHVKNDKIRNEEKGGGVFRKMLI